MKLFLSCASGSRFQATASRNAPSRFRALAQNFSAARIHGGDTRLHGIQVQICATVRNLAHQRQFVKHCRQKNQKKGAERAAFIRSSAPGRMRHFATLPAQLRHLRRSVKSLGANPSLPHRAASATCPPHLRRKKPWVTKPQALPPRTPIRTMRRFAHRYGKPSPFFSRSRAAMRRIAVRSYLS